MPDPSKRYLDREIATSAMRLVEGVGTGFSGFVMCLCRLIGLRWLKFSVEASLLAFGFNVPYVEW